MKRVQLQPLGENLLVDTGTTLLSTLLSKQLAVKMSCGGRGYCSTCRVTVKAGAEMLSPIENRERKTLSMVADVGPDCRLACQSRISGDGVVVELPKGMYIERAEDLLALLGTRAAENILHPITGRVLIPKDKIVTRSLLEQTRALEKEVERMKERAVGAGDSFGSGASGSFGGESLPGRKFLLDSGPRLGPPAGTGSTANLAVNTLTAPPLRAAGTGARPALPPRPAPPPAPKVLEPGAAVGKFLLVERIGRGSSGTVYRALHTMMKSQVAVKFLNATGGTFSAEAIGELRNEAQLLAQLNHPNVVRILDFEDDPALPYVVMEYIEGQSASGLTKQMGRLPAARALALVRQVACGLRAAQAIGILHRDVKPSNILVDADGNAKIVDLGLGVKVGTAAPDAGPGTPKKLCGTAAYIAPEQILGLEPADHRADIYSLGVSAYQMLTGKLPFTGTSLTEIFEQHLTHAPVPPAKRQPDLPPAVSELVMRMMSLEVEARPQTYGELVRELEALEVEMGEPVPA